MSVRGVLGVLLLGLLGYSLFAALPLLSGPKLLLETPVAYGTASDGFVSVSGFSRYTESLTLNESQLLLDENDHFATTLLLPSGSAILTLTATDRFGRSVTERRTVFIP